MGDQNCTKLRDVIHGRPLKLTCTLFFFQMSGTLEKSLMFLICIDPLTTTVCVSVFTVIVIFRYLGIYNSDLCDLTYFSLHTPTLVIYCPPCKIVASRT